jgi:dsDNA-specific endonuclease/ATPase MutS2
MNRIMTLVLTELANDKLKYEENIENLINSKTDVDERLLKIKENLKNVVLVEQMIEKWRGYSNPQSDNNK